jgi:hypothetical protein
MHRSSLLLALALAFAPGCMDASDSASIAPDATEEALADGKAAFVDEDGDGVCDEYPRGRGRGRGWGRGYGRGQLVDEDGDGVCDEYPRGRGRGRGWGRGYGRGQLVDEDGDGVCDQYVDRSTAAN